MKLFLILTMFTIATAITPVANATTTMPAFAKPAIHGALQPPTSAPTKPVRRAEARCQEAMGGVVVCAEFVRVCVWLGSGEEMCYWDQVGAPFSVSGKLRLVDPTPPAVAARKEIWLG